MQGYFRALHLDESTSCNVQLCAYWDPKYDGPGLQCSVGSNRLTYDWKLVTGTWPGIPTSDKHPNGTIIALIGCELKNGPDSYGVVYVDDITMINEAYPASVSVPVPNTPCSPVTVTTTTPTLTSTSATSNPSSTSCPDLTPLESTVVGLEHRLGQVDNAAQTMNSNLATRIKIMQDYISYWNAQPNDGSCGFYVGSVIEAYEFALTQLLADRSDLENVISSAQG
jgi:hypothetical protein